MTSSHYRACWVALLLAITAGCRGSTQAAKPDDAEIATANDNAAAADSAADNQSNAFPVPEDNAAEPAAPAQDKSLDLPASNVTNETQPFPPEVTAFMVDRDSCDHFRGEEAYDEERRAYLEDSIRQLCTGTDERLAILRERYRDDPDVTSALQNYEDRIELPAEE